MKYFVTQVRAVRIDAFKFRKGVVFEMSASKAQELYSQSVAELGPNVELDDDATDLFERGQFVNVHSLGLVFYGKDISDNELFNQRLKGYIAKEVWE